MRVHAAGDHGVLVEFDEIGFDDLHRAVSVLAAADGVVAAIPGHSSVLVLFEDDADPHVVSRLEDRSEAAVVPGEVHRLRLSIDSVDAPDLPMLLQHAGIDRERFASRLAALELRARWLGFLSGFAYLDGVPPEWELPRRTTPRPRVPRGALGLAGPMAGFYPVETPGGWNLVGRTDALLWNPNGERPNLIAPGDTVRIDVVDAIAAEKPAAAGPSPAAGDALIDVESPGQMTLIVGLPEPSRYRFGLPPGGAFDPLALASANLAAGNAPAAPGLECTLVGPRLVARCDFAAAWRGALADIRVDQRPVPDTARFEVEAGSVIDVGPLRGGLRGWLAVGGGVAGRGPRWSAGPERLTTGGYASAGARSTQARVAQIVRGDRREIAVRLGPHLVPAGLRRLLQRGSWQVTRAIDRVGLRISAQIDVPEIPRDLRSCGMQPGSVQWHPDGDLVVMGPDHPVTGGYLQPMTVLSGEMWKLAQLAPGDAVRWVGIGVGE